MRSIALWAHHHRWTARSLILLCYLLLNTMAFATGDILWMEGIVISASWMYAMLWISLAVVFFYPSRKDKKAYLQAFKKRKLFDGILVACTFFMITIAANNNNTYRPSFTGQHTAAYAVQTGVTPLLHLTSKPPQTNFTKGERKAFLKKMKQELRTLYKKMDTASKVALILLAIGVAILAGYAIAFLACSIACSGPEVLGLIIWILGWAGIIVLLVRTISRITKGPKKKKPITEPVPG